jgi:hypothetical protein
MRGRAPMRGENNFWRKKFWRDQEEGKEKGKNILRIKEVHLKIYYIFF